jgi:hypothetical protein
MRFFHHEAHEDHEENAVGYGFLQFPEPLHPVKRDLHMNASSTMSARSSERGAEKKL